MRAAWRQAIQKEGLLSVFRGFGVAVGSTFVYKSLYFGLYVSGVPCRINGIADAHHTQATYSLHTLHTLTNPSNPTQPNPQDSAKPLVLGPQDPSPSSSQSPSSPSAYPSAITPKGLALRTGLAVATTFTAASVSYPLDIIRKRLIVDTAAEAPQYGGSFRKCVREIWRREGMRGFYRFYGELVALSVGGLGVEFGI
jgi:hypothetical protein